MLNAVACVSLLLLLLVCIPCSCLNLVYLLVVVWGLLCWAWGSNRTWTSAPCAAVLQAFTGMHILLLYLSQLPLLQLPALDLPFDVLGLYKLSADPALDPTRAVFVTQIVHMAFLHLLYTMLGFYTALLRQPHYKQLAAEIRKATRKRGSHQPAKQQYGQRQQRQVYRGAGAGSRSSRLGRLSEIDELRAPLLSPTAAGQAAAAAAQFEQLADEEAAVAAATTTADGASTIQLAHQSAAAGAVPTPSTPPVAVAGIAARPSGSSSSSARVILPGTSFRGLLRGERQDWGPIQRFVAEAGDVQDDDAAAAAAVAPPPSVHAAALAAATATAAQAAAASQGGEAGAEGPVLLPGGASPEPIAPSANRGARANKTTSALQQALSHQASESPSDPAATAFASRAAASLQEDSSSTGGVLPEFSAALSRSFSSSSPPAAQALPGVGAVGRWEQAAVIVQVLLPFLVSCGEYLLLQLLAAPAVAGITIAGFALVQVCGPRRPDSFCCLKQQVYSTCTACICMPTFTFTYMCHCRFATVSAGVCGGLCHLGVVTVVPASSQLVRACVFVLLVVFKRAVTMPHAGDAPTFKRASALFAGIAHPT